MSITKTEYDAFKALEADKAHLEQRVKYLLDQMRLVCHTCGILSKLGESRNPSFVSSQKGLKNHSSGL